MSGSSPPPTLADLLAGAAPAPASGVSPTNESSTGNLPKPGDVVADKYEIVSVIGIGGMGAVFEATHLRLRQRVAIKMLHPYVKDLPGSIARFEREARAAGQLRSPNIARVLDVETQKTDTPYMVMEFLEGNDLGVELSAHGRLPIKDAVDYVIQACAGMHEAHALGIIHRDLKPANLFVCRTPDGPIIKILDFGISKITTETDGRLTAAMTTMGSPIYMSPEQLREARDVDARADIWGLGVILYELLAGRPPHTGTVTVVTAAIIADKPPKLSTLRLDVPPGLEAVVLKALSKDPAARFADALSFAQALFPFASKDSEKRLRASVATVQRPSSRREPVHSPDSATVVRPEAVRPGTETSQSWSTGEHRPKPRGGRKTLALVAAIALVVTALVTGLLLSVRGSQSAPERSATSAVAPERPDVNASVGVPSPAPPAPEPQASSSAQPRSTPNPSPPPRPPGPKSTVTPKSAPTPTPTQPEKNPLHL